MQTSQGGIGFILAGTQQGFGGQQDFGAGAGAGQQDLAGAGVGQQSAISSDVFDEPYTIVVAASAATKFIFQIFISITLWVI